jgi:hypothetical protein
MTEQPSVAQGVPCVRDPKIETYLRCGRCDTPICPQCLVHTPVGARCPDCARPQKALQGLVKPSQYAAAIGAGLGVSLVCGAVLGVFPLPFLSGLAMLLIGYVAGEAVSRASNRQRTTGLAFIAFGVTSVGIMIGMWLPTLLRLASVPGGLQLRLLPLLLMQIGPIEAVMLLIAGVIASTRVTR